MPVWRACASVAVAAFANQLMIFAGWLNLVRPTTAESAASTYVDATYHYDLNRNS